jgi:NAD(P)H-flavin reductase
LARIIELHLWVQNKKETWRESEVVNRFGVEQRGKRIVLEIAEGTGIPEMKIAVAKELDKYANKLRYYYVVAVVQRDDGEVGFRTIVPKTIL